MSDRRIVVEVVTPEVVSRLEAEIASLHQENKSLKDQLQQLHKTVYRLMESFVDFKRSFNKS